ncbi:methylase [Pilimelia terevasa]|uniref:peptide chain release factor N(5)-glutamine methyltransferase n=1 Tax=Pilimelia terevasa TaxID=53372 RepID=A0A8J3BPL0_9ACTN|nr:putative protein N(5)-glutamine methyltransferase [Pilimelia terevasa]GGK37415.1 methylase [Pilimelia terevasa]
MSASSLLSTVHALRAAGCVFAEDEARLLHAAAPQPGALAGLLARRVAGTPLEQVLGWARFCGTRVAVHPGVFVPRRRTGLLVRYARGHAGVLVDLCCGTGAVGAAVVAARRRPVTLHAVDIDAAAVDCARANLGRRGRVYRGDLFAPLPAHLRGRVDVITANAPYVPTGALGTLPAEARDHEPRAALDGGADGLDIQRRIAAQAGAWLAPGGRLLLETSAGQAAASAALVAGGGLAATVVTCADLGATVVVGAA